MSRGSRTSRSCLNGIEPPEKSCTHRGALSAWYSVIFSSRPFRAMATRETSLQLLENIWATILRHLRDEIPSEGMTPRPGLGWLCYMIAIATVISVLLDQFSPSGDVSERRNIPPKESQDTREFPSGDCSSYCSKTISLPPYEAGSSGISAPEYR